MIQAKPEHGVGEQLMTCAMAANAIFNKLNAALSMLHAAGMDQHTQIWSHMAQAMHLADSIVRHTDSDRQTDGELARKAETIERLARSVWPDESGKALDRTLFAQLLEEVGELCGACRSVWGRDVRPSVKGSREHVEEELGDVLWLLLRIATLHGVDPLVAADRAIAKFVSRAQAAGYKLDMDMQAAANDDDPQIDRR